MKKKQFLILLLSVSIIFTGLVSCAPNNNNEKGEFDDEILDSVPEDYTLNGNKVGIFYVSWLDKDVQGDEEATDLVYSKIHQRNLIVETRLDCDFVYIPSDAVGGDDWRDAAGEIRQAVQQLDKSFEITIASSNVIIDQKLTSLYHNFNDSAYVNIDEEWWFTDSIMELSVDNYYYRFLSGDIIFSCLGSAGCIFYNKDLYSEYINPGNPDALYSHVFDGTWTLEQFDIECSKSFIDMGGENNIYAFALWRAGEPIHYFANAAGVEYYKRDQSGLPYITLYNQHSVDFTQKLYNLIHANKGVTPYFGLNDDGRASFTDRKTMFAPASLSYILNDGMREMEDNFGILPYPKWDTQQEEYINFAANHSPIIGVTKNVSYDRAMEETSAVLEVMAAEGYRHIKDAFYEQACKRAYSRDDTSVEMLDIITGRHETIKSKLIKNFLYEYASYCDMIGHIFTLIMHDGPTGNPSFTSKWEAREENAIIGLQELITDYIRESN